MAIRRELSLRLQNSPGALARVCEALGDAHVNLIALDVESSGVLRLVPDNPIHAVGILREHQYEVNERDVLMIQMPNDPGALATVTGLLAGAGVNLNYAYASALEGQPMAVVIVGVDDAQRAAAAAGV